MNITFRNIKKITHWKDLIFFISDRYNIIFYIINESHFIGKKVKESSYVFLLTYVQEQWLIRIKKKTADLLPISLNCNLYNDSV